MRLLVVSTWFPYPPDNGSKLRAFHLLRELARRHDVSLLSFCESGRPAADDLARLQNICGTVDVVDRGAFVRGALTARGLLSLTPRSYVQGFSQQMETEIRKKVPAHDAALALQVVAAMHLRHTLTLPAVFEEAEVAVIEEQVASERDPIRHLRRRLTWWKYARFIRALCRQFHHTTVVSDAERARLVRMGCDPARVSVVPNGIDEADLAWQQARQPCRLVYPGALTYSANCDAVRWFLETVLPAIREARPDVEFWVTGSTNGVSVSDLPNAGLATFTGHLADVRPAIAGSTVCVVPLRVGGGTRLKILQAMALGTPVVATSKGAEGLAVMPEQDILVADTPEQFASQVLRLLADRNLQARISRMARQLVQRQFTWTHSGARLEEALGQAVSAWRRRHA